MDWHRQKVVQARGDGGCADFMRSISPGNSVSQKRQSRRWVHSMNYITTLSELHVVGQQTNKLLPRDFIRFVRFWIGLDDHAEGFAYPLRYPDELVEREDLNTMEMAVKSAEC